MGLFGGAFPSFGKVLHKLHRKLCTEPQLPPEATPRSCPEFSVIIPPTHGSGTRVGPYEIIASAALAGWDRELSTFLVVEGLK